MIHTIIQYFHGYLTLYVEGDSAERFLNLCSYHNIYIWNVIIHGNIYELHMKIEDFRKIRPLVRKTHTHIKIKNRFGFPFFVQSHRNRILFLIGIAFCLILLKECSNRIWDVHFSGNQEQTEESLMEFLQSISVYPGMRKKQVDCFQINKAIREQYPDVVWVSASLDGSLLRIKIKENETADEEPLSADLEVETKGTDLIASQDGIITQIITRRGVPLVHVGDEVKRGDVLVSGRLEIKNDSQEVVRYRYDKSDADIFADTVQKYSDRIPTHYQQKQYRSKEQRLILFVQIESWRLEIGSLANSFLNTENESVEYQVDIGENFNLPVYYGYTHVKGYDSVTKRYSNKELETQLNKNFKQFLHKLEEKGIQITGKSVNIHLYDVFASAEGTLYLNQSIAEPVDQK